MINLVQNALKFSFKDSEIKVILKKKICASDQGAIEYKMSVEDKGIGISEKDLKLLFKQPFFQTNDSVSGQMNKEGHGIGLFVSY